ncbi:DUF3267 domain-containing protein [Natrarchaeobius oligotrophus]|uniref:DUF3267 domain-containing protein n=1 Tax=Natrarchaeobius chitinivorans TaxID=1679083 RepID=A0A3N6MUR4_NATCH|nr:DUF3267 domain-containing protein [Natrarchaeobius chitinivorans]RQH00042.1 DUF3267 domain-containing protein [Natrarchaeobius chitinivorans]
MNGTDAPAERPPIGAVRLTRAVALRWLIVSVVGFFASAYCFARALAFVHGRPLEPIVIAPPTASSALFMAVTSIVLVGVVVVVHELLHGAAMKRYGGAASFGVGVSQFVFPAAYAASEGVDYARTQLIVVLVAPFVAITAAGLAVMIVYPTPLLVVALAANAAGSVGDLWTAAILWQYPADARVIDLPGGQRGFALVAPDGGSIDRRSLAKPFSRVAAGSIGTLTLLVAVALVAVLVSLAFGSGTVVIGDPTGRPFLVRHELRDGVAHLEVGASFVALTAVAGGTAWAILCGLFGRSP